MEDRVYNRWAVLQRELPNSEAVIKKLKEESEMGEELFRVHWSRRVFFLFTELNYVRRILAFENNSSHN